MIPLVYNYQVGNPNATYPPSLTVKSSDAGVSVLNLAPTHKYIAFGLTSTPPLPPSLGYLLWTPTSALMGWATVDAIIYSDVTFDEFKVVPPTTVGFIGFGDDGTQRITSVSNFAPYTKLHLIFIGQHFVNTINFEDITMEFSPSIPAPFGVTITLMPTLTSVTNLPRVCNYYDFSGNNLPTSSVENILFELENIGAIDGNLILDSGNNDRFSTEAGSSAYSTLLVRGWTVTLNAGRLPALDTSNDISTTMYKYDYNNVSYYNSSVNSFNTFIDGDYEGVNTITFNYDTFPVDLTTINNLNSYINANVVGISNYPNLTTLDITYLQALELLSIASNPNLTTLTTANYYKNLTFVNLSFNALDANSVNKILIALDNNGKSNGQIAINGGTNAAPDTESAAQAKNNLLAKGWTVLTN